MKMKNMNREYRKPSLENFELSDKSKSQLILAARAFEVSLDEIVDMAVKAIAYRESHEG